MENDIKFKSVSEGGWKKKKYSYKIHFSICGSFLFSSKEKKHLFEVLTSLDILVTC